jgi:hypothetical protein
MQQDRQFTYSIAMTPVCATILTVENQSIAYSECVFLALGIQQSMRLRRIVICVLSSNTQFFHFVL